MITAVSYLSGCIAGTGTGSSHFACVGDPDVVTIGNGSLCFPVRNPFDMDLADLRRRFGEKVTDTLPDCQGLPDALAHSWILGGEAAGIAYSEESIREQCANGCRLSVVNGPCEMRQVNQMGSLRLHELEISRTMGMVQPITLSIARREREEMLELIRRMFTGGVTPMTDSDRYSTNIEGVRAAYDLGVQEPLATRMLLTPGCHALNLATGEKVFVIGPDFKDFTKWSKMIDPSNDLDRWMVLAASKDADGWDVYDMNDDSKVRYALTEELQVATSALWHCRIAVIVEQTPRFAQHIRDCRIAYRDLFLAGCHFDNKTDLAFDYARAVRARAATSVPWSRP